MGGPRACRVVRGWCGWQDEGPPRCPRLNPWNLGIGNLTWQKGLADVIKGMDFKMRRLSWTIMLGPVSLYESLKVTFPGSGWRERRHKRRVREMQCEMPSLALKTEAMSQGMSWSLEPGKDKEMHSPLEPPERNPAQPAS